MDGDDLKWLNELLKRQKKLKDPVEVEESESEEDEPSELSDYKNLDRILETEIVNRKA